MQDIKQILFNKFSFDKFSINFIQQNLHHSVFPVGAVVEGYYAAESAYALCQKQGVDMPIVTAAYQVLYEGASAKDAVLELLHRQKKSEQEDAGWL